MSVIAYVVFFADAGALGVCFGLSTVVVCAVESERWLPRRCAIFREAAAR